MGFQRLIIDSFTEHKSGSFLIVVLSLFLLTGCGEMEEKEVEIGVKGLAKYDHFLAASRMINMMGVEAGSYAHLPEFPPPPNTTLFLPASSIESDGMIEELDDWVYEDGGTLICYLERGGASDVFSYDSSSADTFLEYFDIGYAEVLDILDGSEEIEEEVLPENKEERREYFREKIREELDASKRKKDDDESWKDDGDPSYVKALFFKDTDGMRAEYKTDFINNFYVHYTYEDVENTIFLDFDHGEGRIHVCSTAQPFTNESLMEAEHASLLWDLVKSGNPMQVWFVHSSKLSFWKQLWEKGAYAIVSLGILLFLWIWSSTQRFGPIFNTVNTSKNTLSEHLTSTGYFFSKHKADALIIEQLKGTLYKKLARKTNLPLNSMPEEIIIACKKQETLSEQHLTLLSGSLPDKKKEQLSYISELQQLLSLL